MFEKIIEQLNKAEKITIFPHINMDGDSVGSSKALALALIKYGKTVEILADEQLPDHVAFLDCELFKTQAGFVPDLAFAVDCSDRKRIEQRLDVWDSAELRACIDHHSGEEGFAEASYIDTEASAAALLVYYFIKELGVEIDRAIAEAVYTGILTDTGSFRYSNTDAETHAAAAELMGFGIDHAAICTAVYDNKAYEQLLIEAYALEHMSLVCGGKAAISYIPCEFRNSINALYSYTESSIDVLRSLRGIEVAAVLKEKDRGVYKVSLRSKSYADIASVAFKLGGGGHKKAAACTLEMPLEEALSLLEKEMQAVL